MVCKKLCLFLVSVVVLCSCSTAPDHVKKSDLLQTEYFRLLGDENSTFSQWHTFANRAEKARNWTLLADAQVVLCERAANETRKQQECDKLFIVSHLITDVSQRFDIYLTLIVHTDNRNALDRASELAQSETQKIRLLLAQGQLPTTPIAPELLNSEDLGQYYFLIGREKNDIALLERALNLFEQSGQIHKQADTHYTLALLYWHKKQKAQALASATQSYLILERVNNQQAATRVAGWINDRSTHR
jgi:tetratricopeptide (TPR) repeat protein